MNITEYFGGRSKLFQVILGFIIVLFVGIADYTTGNDISYAIFYLLPISLVGWYVSRWAGVLLCIASAGIWFIADLIAVQSYELPVIPYWNMIVRLGFFLFIVITLSKLKTAFEHEKTLSRTDSLTGVANKRAFYDLASIEIERATRYNRPFSVAYLDIDNFKSINDSLGHSIGDALLQLVATTLKSKLRITDTVARLGGDEFIILLPETKDDSAQKVFQRLRSQLLDAMQKNEWRVTFSIGMAIFISPPDSVEAMITVADEIMYSAKKSGKNMIAQEVIR